MEKNFETMVCDRDLGIESMSFSIPLLYKKCLERGRNLGKFLLF